MWTSVVWLLWLGWWSGYAAIAPFGSMPRREWMMREVSAGLYIIASSAAAIIATIALNG